MLELHRGGDEAEGGRRRHHRAQVVPKRYVHSRLALTATLTSTRRRVHTCMPTSRRRHQTLLLTKGEARR